MNPTSNPSERRSPLLSGFVHLAYDVIVNHGHGLAPDAHKTLICILFGFSDDEIETVLHVSARTTKRRVSEVLRFLGIRRRYEVWPAAFALLADLPNHESLVVAALNSHSDESRAFSETCDNLFNSERVRCIEALNRIDPVVEAAELLGVTTGDLKRKITRLKLKRKPDGTWY